MPTGSPDFNQNPSTNPASPSYDTGEDTTRLLMGGGSQSRGGRCIFSSGFESGLAEFPPPLTSGVSSSVLIDSGKSFQGKNSLKVTSGNNLNDYAQFRKSFILPGSKTGIEFMFSKQAAGYSATEISILISNSAQGVGATFAYTGKIVFVVVSSTDVKMYVEVSGVRTLIKDVTNWWIDDAAYWHYFKMVYDITNNQHIRVYFDDSQNDLGLLSGTVSAPGFIQHTLTYMVEVRSKAATTAIYNFDNLIITMDEV